MYARRDTVLLPSDACDPAFVADFAEAGAPTIAARFSFARRNFGFTLLGSSRLPLYLDSRHQVCIVASVEKGHKQYSAYQSPRFVRKFGYSPISPQ